MNEKKPAPYFPGRGERPQHERAPVISNLDKNISNCLTGEGRNGGRSLGFGIRTCPFTY